MWKEKTKEFDVDMKLDLMVDDEGRIEEASRSKGIATLTKFALSHNHIT